MITIRLERKGADFYTEEHKQASDMENFRLRPYYDGLPSVANYYLKDTYGHYISGDFGIHRPTKAQIPHYGSDEPVLTLDFTDYGTDMKSSMVYDMAREYSGTMSPTLANIKAWLEIVLGEEVKLLLDPEREEE